MDESPRSKVQSPPVVNQLVVASASPLTPDLEERLSDAIEPWLAHMAWRKDFAAWRERRIWQERHQGDNVRDVRRALGSRIEGKALLDLGAGMGGLSVALMREIGLEGLRLQALDYNPDYCRIARLRAERYALQLPIAVGAGEHLPYPSASFDLVVCMDVLEHVADPRAVLAEIARVLKPGGTALTTVPNRHAFRDPHYHLPFINWLPRMLAERIVKIAGRSKEGGPLHDRQELSELNTYTWGGFKCLAERVGFQVRDQVYARIRSGEIRQLRGWRRGLLSVLTRVGLTSLVYRAYRYGWQGTYQIMLQKPR
jgi:ubiquinone/menaquinone biosynthesis C-methylase UbiE